MREEDDYLIGTCQWIEDEEEEKTDFSTLKVRQVLSRYFDALSLNTELPIELGELEIPENAFELSMFIAAILTLPNNQKQTLLELTSTCNRLELEEFLLERATIVHLAYAKRLAQGESTSTNDLSMGPMSDFVSLN
jgi:Lon protease-like protein